MPRAQAPARGGVACPSGSTFQPRAISRSSYNGPQHAAGHADGAVRTVGLLQEVQHRLAVAASSRAGCARRAGSSRLGRGLDAVGYISNVYEKIRWVPYSQSIWSP